MTHHLTDEEIGQVKDLYLPPHQLDVIDFNHNDEVRVAYEWLDAQIHWFEWLFSDEESIRSRPKGTVPRKLISIWSGIDVSKWAIEIALCLHPLYVTSDDYYYNYTHLYDQLIEPRPSRLTNIKTARQLVYPILEIESQYKRNEYAPKP